MFADNNKLNEVREVYGMLEDECSRDIYLNRLNYLITGDMRYIESIVERYLPELTVKKSQNMESLLKKIGNRELVLYGAGTDAIRNIEALKELPITCFCDMKPSLQEKGFYGYPVIAREKLLEKYHGAIVVITTSLYETLIERTLITDGFKKEQIIRLSSFLPCTFSSRQYFEEPFISLQNKKVFLDCGAFDLNTCVEILDKNPDVTKIYAFEPNLINYRQCVMNKEKLQLDAVEVIPAGTWSENTVLYFSENGAGSKIVDNDSETKIQVRKIDDVIREEVSFIKMDVEGAELESLKGAETIIKRDKPLLAICLYHKLEDMTEIPRYIKSLVPEYKLYVRHYCRDARETVLYAVAE